MFDIPKSGFLYIQDTITNGARTHEERINLLIESLPFAFKKLPIRYAKIIKPKIIVQGMVVVLANGRNGSGSTLSFDDVKVTVGTFMIQIEPTSKDKYKKLILSLTISFFG